MLFYCDNYHIKSGWMLIEKLICKELKRENIRRLKIEILLINLINKIKTIFKLKMVIELTFLGSMVRIPNLLSIFPSIISIFPYKASFFLPFYFHTDPSKQINKSTSLHLTFSLSRSAHFTSLKPKWINSHKSYEKHTKERPFKKS